MSMPIPRRSILRVNQLLPRTITSVLMKPQEFARRIKRARSKGYDPRRLVRCLEAVEKELERFGIRMPVYFKALRREARRVTREKDLGTAGRRGRIRVPAERTEEEDEV